MALFLVQHGKCFNKEIDSNRSLSPEGRKEIKRVVNQAADAGITVAAIYHSDKLRAKQTAELFAETLNPGKVESLNGINALDSVERFVEKNQLEDNMMIVGHLPFMERLASFLITNSPEPKIIKFQNAGIVCLDQDEINNWHIKWTIVAVFD